MSTRSPEAFLMNAQGQVVKTLASGKRQGGDFLCSLVTPRGKYIYCLGEDSTIYCFSSEVRDRLLPFTGTMAVLGGQQRSLFSADGQAGAHHQHARVGGDRDDAAPAPEHDRDVGRGRDRADVGRVIVSVKQGRVWRALKALNLAGERGRCFRREISILVPSGLRTCKQTSRDATLRHVPRGACAHVARMALEGPATLKAVSMGSRAATANE